MDTIFKSCVPRPEVLQGELREDMFAARLRDVMLQSAASIYQDGDQFFNNTYPTGGLRTLLEEAMGRLTGAKATSPVIRLETSFGGGKTHNLIALYHLAKKNANPDVLQDFVDQMLLPEKPIEMVAGVVGSDMDVDNGIDHGDVTTFTLWGEIAYQLKGKEGYDLMEKSDKSGIAPGSQVLERLIGDGPALIMIDEVARYLRSAGAKQVKGAQKGNTLAKQTVAFFMTLLEYAVSRPNVVLVYTLADSKDAFSHETEAITQEIEEIKKISARQERVLRPTGEGEISAIVNHRLFSEVDKDIGKKVASGYLDYYRSLKDINLSPYATRAEYKDELVDNYPLHSDFLNTLNRKTATIPNFQKTRGALRLLALVVRDLWKKKPSSTYMIHAHHMNFANNELVNELTSRLQRPAYSSVIESDIYSPLQGSVSHSEIIDEEWTGIGKPPYARRISTTILLHSLTQGAANGVEPEYLWLSVLQPEDDPALLKKALDQLKKKCWFLDFDGFRYRFKTEPSINKIIDDEVSTIGNTKPKRKIEEMIRRNWKSGIFDVQYFPADPGEVDDDTGKPKLVIPHFDAATSSTTNEEAPEMVFRLFKHAGASGGFRKYKNNLVFLVADEDQVENMVNVAKRYMAILKIIEDEDRFRDFSEENQKKIKELRDSSELKLKVAISKTYRYLYYPSTDVPQKAGNLARATMPTKEHGRMEEQSKSVLELLRSMEKVLTEKEKPLSAAFVKAKAWSHNALSMTTNEIKQAFAQKLSLRILLDINQLKKTIREGAKNGHWVYYDTEKKEAFGKSSPAPSVKFSENIILYLPDEANRLKIVPIGEEEPEEEAYCPVCGEKEKECICHQVGTPTPPVKTLLRAEGAPGQVFQEVADKAKDQGITELSELKISIDGEGETALEDAKALELVVPQMGARTCYVDKVVTAELDSQEHFKFEFKGAWDKFRKVKDISQQLENIASKITLTMQIQASYGQGLEINSPQYQGMKETIVNMGMGKVVLDAKPKDEE